MTTILSPLNAGDAIDLGRLWRKQVLKYGTIRTNDGQRLDITPELVQDLAQSFADGAYDQVPLQLVDRDNRHNSAPENYRGQVKGFEVTPDGLDMILEPSPKGAELLRENPNLGVSARIVPNYQRSDGRQWRAAIEHVAGTLNPVVTGMRPWEAVNLSSTDDGEVIDLSGEEITMADEPTDQEQPAVIDDQAAEQIVNDADLSPEDLAAIRELLQEHFDGGEPADEDHDEDADNGSEDDNDDEPDLPARDESEELVTANLSVEARAAIDLANATAQAAEERTAALEWQLAEERADREAANYINAGVPPAEVNLARPALAVSGQVIDLSNGEQTDTLAIIRGLLDARKGTVDLSREKGHGDMSADERAHHDALMAAWDKDFPQSNRNSK